MSTNIQTDKALGLTCAGGRAGPGCGAAAQRAGDGGCARAEGVARQAADAARAAHHALTGGRHDDPVGRWLQHGALVD